MRGATNCSTIFRCEAAVIFQLTRPMRGATIRAKINNFYIYNNFNSHAPCGAQPASIWRRKGRGEFQLTRPMRGATMFRSQCVWIFNISTHTPHAGRNKLIKNIFFLHIISTHTPHAGRNDLRVGFFTFARNFNSHAPCGAQR